MFRLNELSLPHKILLNKSQNGFSLWPCEGKVKKNWNCVKLLYRLIECAVTSPVSTESQGLIVGKNVIKNNTIRHKCLIKNQQLNTKSTMQKHLHSLHFKNTCFIFLILPCLERIYRIIVYFSLNDKKFLTIFSPILFFFYKSNFYP